MKALDRRKAVIWFVLAWCLIAISIGAFATATSLTDDADDETSLKFIIMMDAGSTGTRIHVFQYKEGEPLPAVKPFKTLKITPGLSSYEHNPKGGGESLKPLLDFAKAHIPLSRWHRTSAFLKATAGLRSVPFEAAHAILAECRNVLSHYPFQFESSHAQIISGKDEGIFGWVTANYLEGGFRTGHPTVGVIEMGGASMQVTFVPETPLDPAMEEHVIEVPIGSTVYNVYTHSYLNYGLEAAQKLLQSKLSSLEGAELLGDGNPCYLKDYRLRDGTEGSGSHEKCSTLLDVLFDKSNCSFMPPTCSFNGVFQPKITTEKFYAIENFFYTMDFFDLDDHLDAFGQILPKGREFCNLPWNEAVAKFPSQKPDDLAKFCFSSAFLPKVMEHALGVPTPSKSARIARTINGVQIDWALGAAVFELNALRKKEREKQLLWVAKNLSQIQSNSSLFPPSVLEACGPLGSAGPTAVVFVLLTVGITVYVLRRRRYGQSAFGFLSSWSANGSRTPMKPGSRVPTPLSPYDRV